MNQKINNHASFIRILFDIAVMILSHYLTGFICYGEIYYDFAEDGFHSLLWILVSSYIIIYLFFVSLSSRRPWMYNSFWRESYSIIKYHSVLFIFVIAYLYIFNLEKRYSIYEIILFFVIDIFLMIITHNLLRIGFIKLYRNTSYCERVLLITNKDNLYDINNKIRKTNNWYFRIKGIAVIDADMRGMYVNSVPVIAGVEDLYDTSQKKAFDAVLICIDKAFTYDVQDMLGKFLDMGMTVHYNIEEYYYPVSAIRTVGNVGVLGVVTYSEFEYGVLQIIGKRTLDIIGGIVGMFLFGLAMLIFGPLIKLDSKGPVLFSQVRVGKNGRRFKIYKFRSMYQDAEERKAELMDQNEMSGGMFKMHNDPRITRVGKFIRKTSIDELPQFWNVLKGDMSLVGTRPPTVEEFEGYTMAQRKRICIKPGITGLWQVSGRSSITDFDKVVELDCEYIDNWSLARDIKIILKTIWVVIFGKGAE